MMKLSEKEWKLKKLTDDFRPVRGRESNMAMLELGDIPLISAKNGSNGVKGFVNTPKKLVDGGCITLNNDGDGGAGLAYYQSTEMALDTHVTALIPRTDMKPDTMLFASECISKLHGFFGHGLSISNKRVKNIKIMLPVIDSGEPDYEYMAEYTKQAREKLLSRYREYVEKRIAELGEEVEIPALSEKTWESFAVEELFGKPISTKGKTTGDLIAGDDVPYIAAANSNNGYAGMYSAKEHPEWVSDGNAIVFVQLGDGAAGLAYYEPCNFIGMSGKTSCGYSEHLNEYTGVFMARCLSVNKEIFSHGHSWTGKRLVRTKVMLPINDSGEPDYEYMEQYAKNMMLRKYKQYLTFLDRHSR